jgi:hypothetical protein
MAPVNWTFEQYFYQQQIDTDLFVVDVEGISRRKILKCEFASWNEVQGTVGDWVIVAIRVITCEVLIRSPYAEDELVEA